MGALISRLFTRFEQCNVISRLFNRLEQCNDPESSSPPHSAYAEPVSLNLGLRVFLSHSGRDKDFVRRLYRELCTFYHGFKVAFFDEESIPNAEAVNMDKSILEEAKKSELGVLVITDDFFTHTQNPMLELEAFVTNNVKLLPLFFKINVDEFKKEERWNKWEKVWKKLAAENDKLKTDNWRSYLSVVSTYKGLEFYKIAPCGREDIYIDEVVRQIACIIGPVNPMIGNNVAGKDRLCEEIDKYYNECSSRRSSLIDGTAAGTSSTTSNLGLGENSGFYEYNVVGIHGFSESGKTTLSKCLCDFYFKQMKGNVCYIDLGLLSETKRSRMQHVLSRLDRRNCRDICSSQLYDNQVENLLGERLSSMQDPIFLAVDNIPPDEESKKEVLIYLRCRFPKRSKIFITSRDKKTLSQLTGLIGRSCSFQTVIKYMPELIDEEAREIFKHEIPDLHNFWHSNPSAVEENMQRDVDACVRMCTIFNGQRYHPLMLKSLAAFVSRDQLGSNLDWKGRLAELASAGIVDKGNAWKQVYHLFDITYNLLTKKEKEVFLDSVFCYNIALISKWYEWIHALHVTYTFKKECLEEILLRLHSLCFIEKEEDEMKIHDLVVGFGKHKAGEDLTRCDHSLGVCTGASAGADTPHGYLVLEDGGLDALELPTTVRHVNISRCKFRTLDLEDVEGVRVLHLLDNAGPAEVLLSRTSSARLHSLIVRVPAGTALRCVVNKKYRSSQFLKWIHIEGDFNFCFQRASDRLFVLPNDRMLAFLEGFQNLHHFKLTSNVPGVETIDLTPCANLKLLHVSSMLGLKSIRGPENSSHLKDVSIMDLPDLEELTIDAHEKMCLRIIKCASLRQVFLKCTTPSARNAGLFESGRLPAVFVSRCPQVRDLSSLGQWRSLDSLTLSGCTSVEVWPDFAAMTSLRWLDLSNNTSLREWPPGVLLLPSLEHLDLRGCPQLPAKEVLLRTITPTHPWDSETDPWSLASPLAKCWWACQALRADLRDETRDKCTVAVALHELSVELAAIFDRWCPQSAAKRKILLAILMLIHEVWFLKPRRYWGGVSDDGEEPHITEHMIALLSTESFLSLPFRACRRCDREEKRWTFCYTGAVIGVLGVYTVLMAGRASSTDSHRSHHLRDMTIFLFRVVIGFLIQSEDLINVAIRRGDPDHKVESTALFDPEVILREEVEVDPEVVREKVGVVVRRMAREAGVEVEEGSPESQQLKELRDRAVEALCTIVAANPDDVKVGDIIREMRALWCGRWSLASSRWKGQRLERRQDFTVGPDVAATEDDEFRKLRELWNKRWPFDLPWL